MPAPGPSPDGAGVPQRQQPEGVSRSQQMSWGRKVEAQETGRAWEDREVGYGVQQQPGMGFPEESWGKLGPISSTLQHEEMGSGYLAKSGRTSISLTFHQEGTFLVQRTLLVFLKFIYYSGKESECVNVRAGASTGGRSGSGFGKCQVKPWFPSWH